MKQLSPAILEACFQLNTHLKAVEDLNIDIVCQTSLATREYDGQPDPESIETVANELLNIARITKTLINYTTSDERRQIEEQGLVPWRFKD